MRVPLIGVNAKRDGTTPILETASIISTASFSDSPSPTIMCVPTLPLPKTSTAALREPMISSNPLPFTDVNLFLSAQSTGTVRISAPASLSLSISPIVMGGTETENGSPAGARRFMIASASDAIPGSSEHCRQTLLRVAAPIRVLATSLRLNLGHSILEILLLSP